MPNAKTDQCEVKGLYRRRVHRLVQINLGDIRKMKEEHMKLMLDGKQFYFDEAEESYRSPAGLIYWNIDGLPKAPGPRYVRRRRRRKIVIIYCLDMGIPEKKSSMTVKWALSKRIASTMKRSTTATAKTAAQNRLIM